MRACNEMFVPSLTTRLAVGGHVRRWRYAALSHTPTLRHIARMATHTHPCALNAYCTVQPQKHTNVGPQRSRLESTLDRLATLVPDEATIPIESLVNGKAKPTFRIIVTTAARMEQVSSQSDLGSATRFVVLDTQSMGEHRSAWLNINCNEDIASQLRKEWERRCHDTWSAN